MYIRLVSVCHKPRVCVFCSAGVGYTVRAILETGGDAMTATGEDSPITVTGASPRARLFDLVSMPLTGGLSPSPAALKASCDV